MRYVIGYLRARDHRTGVPVVVLRARRAALVARIRRKAARVGSTVDLDVARDLWCAPDVEVDVAPGTHSRLVIRSGCRIRRHVLIQLKGGTIELGEDVELWRGVRLNVAGHFVAEGSNIFSEWLTVHCANRVRVGRRTILGEHVTIADTSHAHPSDGGWTYHALRHGTVDIGANTWVAAKVTIGRDSVVGDDCVLGANSVVTGEVPDGHVATGIPAVARPRRQAAASD